MFSYHSTPRRYGRALKNRIRSVVLAHTRADNPGPRFIANTVPKAGTHLLMRCLDLFPDLVYSGIFLNYRKRDPDYYHLKLQKLGGGSFVRAHLPYDQQWAQMFAELDLPMVMVVRDLRDVAVSAFHYLTYKSNDHNRQPYFRSLPDDSARLHAVIVGDDEVGMEDIGSRLAPFSKWINHNSCVLKFERLIGPNGGGLREWQIKEIERLADFLHVSLHTIEVEQIADHVFNQSSPTFRKGVIGDWRNHFTEVHKDAFKEVAGQLLIDFGYETDLNW